ncbi:hypothetical protein ES703_19921 [subsurface metagenome]
MPLAACFAESCLRQAQKQELRIQKTEVRIKNYRVSYILYSVFCILFSVLVENDPDKTGFGVWPKPKLLTFLKEVYYV